MKNASPERIYRRRVAGVCLLVLGCIAVAGFWPFHVQRNKVNWIQGENGLNFGRHGSAVSASAFGASRSSDATGNSLEIWLTPARVPGGGSIISFDSSSDRQAPFLLRQYGDSIAVHRYLIDEHGNISQPFLRSGRVFDTGKSVFVSLVSNQSNTDIYVNGALTRTFSNQGITSAELTGRLVLANSTTDDSWAGRISGLAVYDRSLSPSEVSAHFNAWTSGQAKSVTAEPSLAALYLFDEREGNTVHNLVNPATNLTIPVRYFILHPMFLRSVWNQYSHTRSAWKKRSFWEDLGVNVGGFMPVGFAFFAYFSSRKRLGHPVLSVIFMGFLLSFTVEALQWLLPNRDSGMTDVVTNTTGTALGVLLYQSSMVRALWMKILNFGIPRPQSVVVEANKTAQDEKLTFST
jgi:VanZ family protein